MKAIDPAQEEQLEGQMSFLEHLDELRRRLVRSILFVAAAFFFCWAYSGEIFRFLAVPVTRELSAATQRKIENKESFPTLEDGSVGRYVFDRKTNLGMVVMPVGSSVLSKVGPCDEQKLCIFTEEDLIVGEFLVPKGVKIAELTKGATATEAINERLIVTTATESFTLYVTVSLYAAIALAVPFLLWQIWGFISPALYQHERRYATPFIGLSTVSFVIGAAFAYYILFPPAIRYLIGLGEDFNVMLRATDYFDFITLIMLAMGGIFQMPAITYVLARIGIVSAGLLLKSWKIALIVILFLAAIISPTADIPNMMLFAAPMTALYLFSILIAWIFGKKRQKHEEI